MTAVTSAKDVIFGRLVALSVRRLNEWTSFSEMFGRDGRLGQETIDYILETIWI